MRQATPQFEGPGPPDRGLTSALERGELNGTPTSHLRRQPNLLRGR